MRFKISVSPMNGSEEVLDALDVILGRAEQDVHELEILAADKLEQTQWYQLSREGRRKSLQEFASQPIYRGVRAATGPHLRCVTVDDTSAAVSAQKLALAPLRVLTENAESDGALVEAAIRLFASPKTLTICFGPPRQLEPPAFTIESGGGHGELMKLVRRSLAEAEARGRPPRLVVVADSDGEWRGDAKDHVLEIRERCAEANISCPHLNKRTAENYIPDAVWQAWAAAPDNVVVRPWVKALLRMTPIQRDFVHMALRGKEPWDSGKPEAKALFSDVPVEDQELLRVSDLKGKRSEMLIFNLVKYANHLASDDLDRRDHGGDLRALVRAIEEEL